MTLIKQNTVTNPQGQTITQPTAGPVPTNPVVLLGPGEVWRSGILPYGGLSAIDYQVVSDVAGTIMATYYDAAGNTSAFTPVPAPYDPVGNIQSFQSALNVKRAAVEFIFTNGQVAQTIFEFNINFSNGVQPTMQSAKTSITDTNLAVVGKSTLQGKQDGAGARKEATITISGSKVAQDVNIVNPMQATDVSALATALNQTNGKNTVQIVDGNNQNFGTTARPLNVTVSNPVAAPTTIAVSNFPTSTEIANDSGNPIPVSGSFYPATQPISGSVSVSNFPATQAVTLASSPLPAGASTEATLQLLLTALNAVNTDQGAPADPQATSSTVSASEIALLKGILQRPANSSTTAVTVAATQSTVLAANASRKGCALYSVTGLNISLGATCSATVFTTKLSANTYYEIPFGYTGIITSFGSAATIQVTELT